MNLLGTVEPYQGNELEMIYQDAFRGVYFSTVITVSLNGEITVNHEPYQVPMKKGKIDWKQLAFSV